MAETWGEDALVQVTSNAVKELQQKSQRRGGRGGGGGGGGGGGKAIGGMAAQWEKEKALAEAETTINLGIGMPASESIPKQELLASIQRGAFADEGDGATDKMWGYDGSQGYRTLREGMAEHFSAVRGVPVTPDHFLIEGGGGGAIATIAQTFLNPGDAVIAERPGYMGVMDSFVEQHARLAGVPLDDDGMKLDVLEATIDALAAEGHTTKLLYLQALFHNPRGQCYTRERMLGLIELCARKKVLILNDEACACTPQPSSRHTSPHAHSPGRRRSCPLAPLCTASSLFLAAVFFRSNARDALAAADYGLDLDPTRPFDYMSALPGATGVISTGTFSKTIAPGLRLGWVFGPPPLVRLCTTLCSAAKPNGRSTVLCAGLGEFINSGQWDAQIASVQALYRQKMEAVAASVEEHCKPWLSFDRPAGGVYLWLKLNKELPSAMVNDAAAARGLLLRSGAMYYRYSMLEGMQGDDAIEDSGEDGRFLRLCFSQPSVEELGKVGQRLAAACEDVAAHLAQVAEAEAEAELAPAARL